MHKRLFAALALLALFALPSCDTLQAIAKDVMTEPSLSEIGQGLKDALGKGVSKGVNELSLRDGFLKSAYKILLPEEAQRVSAQLRSVPGFSNLENELIERINRGAEEAAKEAGPIFMSAIKQMTFDDAMKILMGADNSATEYLRRTTSQQLYDKFKPIISRSLDQVGLNNLWRNAADTYNKIPLINKKVGNDMSDYVTNEALKGLFGKITEEEKNIRRNKNARNTDLLRKVFAKQDANRK